MKNITILAAIALCCASTSFCQPVRDKSLSICLSGGPSLASSGDMNGLYVSTTLSKRINKWSYAIELSSTVHDKQNEILYKAPDGSLNDASVRSTTSGIQLNSLVGYSVIKDEKDDLTLALGAAIRYQTTSVYDDYFVLYPSITGLNYPVVLFNNSSPMRSFAIGPVLKGSYTYSISPKLGVALMAAFQFDTHGDNFFNRGLSITYKL